LLERKLLASIQSRKGPNKIGFLGLLQPIADGFKLIMKETIIPTRSFKTIFFLSAIYSLFLSLLLWTIFPFSYFFVISDMEYGLLFFFILSILHVYSIMLAGWSSNSRYSFLGGLRSSAQLIAYDVTMVIVLLNIILFTKTLNIIKIIEYQSKHGWFIFYLPISFIIFLICALAETNRHPFDLPEAEAELVSGYNVEYSAVNFSLFFLGEYSSMLFMAGFTVHLFLGGWTFIDFSFLTFFWNKLIAFILYIIKLSCVIYFFVIIRAAVPRYRYDQLMRIGWKYLLPLAFANFLINCFLVYFFSNPAITAEATSFKDIF
jgi:NADH-quinone oxidoreductase subunit H